MEKQSRLSKLRLLLGGFVFISGFLSPLLVSAVTNTSWSTVLKTTLSGLLIFGIPELFMVIAIAITGKRGLAFLKNLLFRFIKGFLSHNVSKLQYRIGLFMVLFPLFIGLLFPYLQNTIKPSLTTVITLSISLDFIMITGVFIAGEDFWKKLMAVFSYKN